MIDLSIHRVKQIDTELRTFDDTRTKRFYTLKIWITTENGKEEITLFSENKESLKIHN